MARTDCRKISENSRRLQSKFVWRIIFQFYLCEKWRCGLGERFTLTFKIHSAISLCNKSWFSEHFDGFLIFCENSETYLLFQPYWGFTVLARSSEMTLYTPSSPSTLLLLLTTLNLTLTTMLYDLFNLICSIQFVDSVPVNHS